MCVFFVEFIRDTESRNEIFLVFGFLFGYYMGHYIVCSLLYKTAKKINIEIELVIKDYSASTTTTISSYKFVHFKKLIEKTI